MKLTEKELYDMPLGTKAIQDEKVYMKISGNQWKKPYSVYPYTNREIAMIAEDFATPNYTPYNPKYTYVKLRDEPIGTKITFKDGNYMVKCKKDEYHMSSEQGKYEEEDIVKVEIPTGYKTIYEI